MKLVKALLVLFCLIQCLLARKQFLRPLCNNILLLEDCQLQAHCSWNYNFDTCETARTLLVRRHGVHVRPYARFGGYMSRGYVPRPSVAVSRPMMSVSRPSMSVARPSMNVSRPVSMGRPMGARHRRIRRF